MPNLVKIGACLHIRKHALFQPHEHKAATEEASEHDLFPTTLLVTAVTRFDNGYARFSGPAPVDRSTPA